jgi:hypothetical protein
VLECSTRSDVVSASEDEDSTGVEMSDEASDDWVGRTGSPVSDATLEMEMTLLLGETSDENEVD